MTKFAMNKRDWQIEYLSCASTDDKTLRKLMCMQGDRFKLATQAFDRQYAHIYFQRLMLMKPPLLTKVRQKWPGVQCKKLMQMSHRFYVMTGVSAITVFVLQWPTS